MANRRNGSSWSLFGEGEVYRKKVDPFEAIYGVRKEEIKGIYQTKGMACSVYVKKDEKEVAHFVTWSGVTRDLLNKPAQVNCFSSQHFGTYTAPVDSNSTVETFGHFSFLPAGPIFASLSSKKFIVAFKPLEQEEDLKAYYFVGSEKLTLKLDTKTHKLVTFSEEDRQKLELSPSSVLGAPIIGKNKNISSHNSGRWCVVGVVGLSGEGELCPHFVTSEIFEQPGPTCSDAVQPPISQTPENSTNPPGGEAVDASGQPGPSDAVQPPISQTPENSTNPPGGEAVGASDIILKVTLRLARGGLWAAGVAFILTKYANDPETVIRLFNQFAFPAGVVLSLLIPGSLICILQVNDLYGLRTLWQNYKSGLLKKKLEYVLITEDLCKLARGDEIIMDVFLEERMYRDACLALNLNQAKGTDSGGIPKVHLQRPEKQLPAITSGSLHGHPSVHKQKINEDTDTSKTSGDELSLSEVGDTLIKLLISAPGLQKEQQKEVYKTLALQVQNFLKFHEHSTDDLQGVVALTEFIKNAYQVHLKSVSMGSLEVIVDCPTLKSLERLWNDYLSGHLNNVTERYLVTIEMKQQLGLETISLKTTIEEENYLTCKHVLLEMPGGLDSTCLSSQQGVLDQGASTSGMNITADYKKVKEQDTSWAMRMEKAKVSRSALHRASINGQYEEVNRHLKSGANVDERDQFSLTPLHLACWYGHESVVKLLLAHNADVNAVDRFQFTPLQKAERWNYRSIIQLLLDHDAKPSFQQPLSLKTLAKRAFLRTDSHSGFNVLQAVVLEGDYDSVYKASTLLENFVEQMECETISTNASICRGKSAVDILSAVYWRKPGHAAIKGLYRRLVEIDETLNELHSCAKSGDVEKVIELVLNNGVDVNVAAKSNITPLLWASPMSSGVLIKTLIDLGADVNAQTAPGKGGPLGFAASSNNYMVARVLLEHSADANIKYQLGETPLYKAVRRKNVPLVKLLLENKADANIQNYWGERPLQKAVTMSDVTLVKLLLESKTDVNIKDRKGETLLNKAVTQTNVPLVELLLENKADANIQDGEGETPLHKAVAQRNGPLIELLLENKADVNIKDRKGETPLNKAVTQKDEPLVKLLLENKADPNIQSLFGEIPLYSAVMQRNIPIVMLLLENKADANFQGNKVETPLHKAVRQKDVALVKLLLENKADANIQDWEKETALHKAVAQKEVPLVKLLLENKADANIEDKEGETPLLKAVTQKDEPLVKLLLENKADANIQGNKKETPLHKAVRQKDVPLIKLLLENKADANIQDWVGETPLHKATTQKDVPLVKLLLENKADANIQDWEKETALHKAVAQKKVPLVKLLLENKADVKIKDRKGETPLNKAVTQKDEPLVKLLLENKADANIQGNKKETPLHKAVRQKDVPLVKLLLENKADANIQDWVGETPLHKATTQKDVPLVKLLLENKADANIQDWEKETALHKAVAQKKVPLVKLLLENKTDVNIKDRKGETPLNKAVTQKNEPLVKLLLENKADANIQNLLGETPFHNAVIQKDVSIIKLLLENKADGNIRDWVGETPLQIAITQGDGPLIKLLLENSK
ncbi:serine/threonine-protein phosphatase 6 regulatory ankyrin repeat subunit C-like isoform X2 [Montipora foliosa]|uniref:serine/threonine-protein phosphatase 6 regulatory ankyrin repeat subunit C-like isoform X2 n=1 Tax=Montipora foliosa TaxID=591990 RepID=UPI0035F1D073